MKSDLKNASSDFVQKKIGMQIKTVVDNLLYVHGPSRLIMNYRQIFFPPERVM